MSGRVELLVLGLGNPLCGDDGAGIAAVARLVEGWSAPEGTVVLDGGTLGLSLLPYLGSAQGDPRGCRPRRRAAGHPLPPATERTSPRLRRKLSPHQVGVADLLDSVRLLGGYPEAFVLVGVVPAQLELSLERSPAVAARIDDLVLATVQEAARMGHVFTRREHNDTDDAVRGAPHDRILGL